MRVAGVAACLGVLFLLFGCGGLPAEAPATNGRAEAQQGGSGVVVLEEEGGTSAGSVASAAGFDYYVLALSWSPQHCATPAGRNDSTQCGGPRRFGFIVHGLWPQYERGWPQDCSTSHTLPQSVVREAFAIMPSARLIRHEWAKHGTCSGLTAADYFALARKAFGRVRAPEGYGTPDTQINVSPAKYKSAWLDANPELSASGVAVLCSGRFLQEVRICLDKNLKPRPCGRDVRDRCRVPEMIVRPVR